ncbi:MAG: DUF2974 domain-containing protein [Oscillospiraceae bacterium]|nr:DUF2974 domain-containing protein [Oscillospiraceae bacterium]
MTNILDYLDWRGDIRMEKDPFNTVDAIILSEICYLPLEHLAPKAFCIGKPLLEIAKAFQPDAVKTSEKPLTFQDDVILLKKAVKSERFRSVRIMGAKRITDPAQNVQFAAFTCVLPTGEYYITFRGTDSSIAGWKEDFSFSYENETAGQRYATEYLNSHDGASHELLIGGHSKGGNFAVYAAVSCVPRVKKLIRRIYSFDSPGFRDEFAASEAYHAMLPLIVSVIPQSSLIGQILTSHTEHRIVHSHAGGIMQHFMYSWEIMRNHPVYTEELSRLGVLINRTLRHWLSTVDDDSRRSLTEALFDVISASDADTFGEISQNKLKSVKKIYAAMKALDPDQQWVVRKVIKKLISSSGLALRTEIRQFTKREDKEWLTMHPKHPD